MTAQIINLQDYRRRRQLQDWHRMSLLSKQPHWIAYYHGGTDCGDPSTWKWELWAVLNGLDATQITLDAIAQAEKYHASEMQRLRDTVAALKAKEVQ